MIGEHYNAGRWVFLDPEGNENSRERNPFLTALKTGRPSDYVEVLLVRPDRKTINLMINASPMLYGSGEIESVVVSFNDITDLKRAEGRAMTALKEKEVLLREVHHRVKNNFQIISSLISLQSRHFHDERDVALIAQTQQRIRSISMIYEKLNASDRVSSINLADYMRALADDIFISIDPHNTMRSVCSLESIDVPVKTAITCGIIVNELLTNAAKHAFDGVRAGVIEIGCAAADGTIRLWIADNGRGLPEGFDPSTSPSMGLQLVNALVAQLEGRLDYECDEGARFSVSFPLHTPVSA